MITSRNTSYPKRAALLALHPIGVGTSRVESLESYTLRLAKAHDVTRKTIERFVNNYGDRLYCDESGPPRLDALLDTYPLPTP